MTDETNMETTDVHRLALNQYEAYYQISGLLRETDAFYRWVLDRLSARRGTLLDVACGEGHMVVWAQQHGLSGYGIDFSMTAIQTASTISRSGRVLVGNGEVIPFADNTFDFVTNLGSLEHFADPSRGLGEMKRVLRPGGRIGLLVPNSYYLLDIIWHVWRCGYPVSHSQTIERFATVGQWSDLIQQNGLRILEEHKYNLCFPRTAHDIGWYCKSPLKLAYPLFSPLTPFNLSYSFLFVCTHP